MERYIVHTDGTPAVNGVAKRLDGMQQHVRLHAAAAESTTAGLPRRASSC